MTPQILSAEEVAKRRSMHICASSRRSGCEYDEALDSHEGLRAERDRLAARLTHMEWERNGARSLLAEACADRDEWKRKYLTYVIEESQRQGKPIEERLAP